MRIDPRPTVPASVPLFRAYAGTSLRAFLQDGHLADEWIRECASAAIEAGDKAGLRLARLLLRMSRKQRQRLKYLLTLSANAS